MRLNGHSLLSGHPFRLNLFLRFFSSFPERQSETNKNCHYAIPIRLRDQTNWLWKKRTSGSMQERDTQQKKKQRKGFAGRTVPAKCNRVPGRVGMLLPAHCCRLRQLRLVCHKPACTSHQCRLSNLCNHHFLTVCEQRAGDDDNGRKGRSVVGLQRYGGDEDEKKTEAEIS